MSYFNLKEGIRKQLKIYAFATVMGLFLIIGLLYLHFSLEARRAKAKKVNTAGSPTPTLYKAVNKKKTN